MQGLRRVSYRRLGRVAGHVPFKMTPHLADPGYVRLPQRTLNWPGVALVDIVEQTQQIFE